MIYLLKRNNSTSNNTFGVLYEVVNDPRVFNVGFILSDVQIMNLKEKGNTVINYSIVEQLKPRVLLDEINRLVGFECIVTVYKLHEPYIVIVERRPKLTYRIFDKSEKIVIYKNYSRFVEFSTTTNLDFVKKELSKYCTKEEIDNIREEKGDFVVIEPDKEVKVSE